MNAQFKPKEFNIETLKKFVQDIENEQIKIEVEWKAGKQKTDNPDSNTNCLIIKHNNKLLFQQTAVSGSRGLVNLDELNEKDKLFVLKLLKINGFFTNPSWALGVFLSLIYVVVISLISYANSGTLGFFLLLFMIMTMVFMIVQFGWSQNKVSSKTFKWFYVCGIGYLLTSPISMVNIVLFIQVSYNKLYNEIQNI